MFRTELHLPPADHLLNLRDTILTSGSCFSECMGDRLVKHKFRALANPFGTVFNPLSITKLLKRALNDDYISQNELVYYNEIWSHYDFHTAFSGTDPGQVTDRVNERIREVGIFLKECQVILLTYGTAFIYRLAGKLVSNCHKHPGKWFEREMLSASEIAKDFKELAQQLPDTRFILTVSPVRHTRDTLPLNSLSKSVLRVACNAAISEVPRAEYFPSYEIMLDDLRDYRFFGPDMIHPTPIAEDYIWDKFIGHYFSEADQELIGKVGKIQRSLSHRPVHPGTDAHVRFMQSLLSEMRSLSLAVDFGNEIKKIEKELTLFP